MYNQLSLIKCNSTSILRSGSEDNVDGKNFKLTQCREYSFNDEGVEDESFLSSDEEQDLTYLVDREIRVMSELDHPHIVHLEEVYEDNETACFVMELAKGGEVFDRLVQKASFDEISVADHIVQLLSGLYIINLETKNRCR